MNVVHILPVQWKFTYLQQSNLMKAWSEWRAKHIYSNPNRSFVFWTSFSISVWLKMAMGIFQSINN